MEDGEKEGEEKKEKRNRVEKKRTYRRIFPVYQLHAAVALYFISVVTNNGEAEGREGAIVLLV